MVQRGLQKGVACANWQLTETVVQLSNFTACTHRWTGVQRGLPEGAASVKLML
jgi:hypothetical protein